MPLRTPSQASWTTSSATARVLHVVPRDGEHRGVVAFDERLERALVTRAQAREELGLLRGRPVLKSGLGHRPTLTARCRASPGS